jgi:hypothetical protein
MWEQEEDIHGYDTAETRQLGEYIAAAAASVPKT